LVASIVALIVALRGMSYAAISLPNGSVGTKQLKDKAVNNAKPGPGSVGTAKIKNGAVAASKINTTGLTVPNATNATNATNSTNSTNATDATDAANATNAANAADAANAANAADAANATNAANAATANRLAGIQIVAGPDVTLNNPPLPGQGSEVAICPPGVVAISGGAVNTPTGQANAVSLNSVVMDAGAVTVFINNTSPNTITRHAYAVCVDGPSSGSSARPG
jgi:hypothetical protein